MQIFRDENGVRWRQNHRAAQISTPSLWHRSCNHFIYGVSCADFERMLVLAGFACQRCRSPHEKLGIDHDHSVGDHGVRGLLCPSCNRIMANFDAGTRGLDEETAHYLAKPFVREFPVPLMTVCKA